MMARPYTSQLQLMKELATKQGVGKEAFDEQYMLHYEQLYRYRRTDACAVETFDILYFLVEKDTWSYFWPNDEFPGEDPRNTYESQLESMKRKAITEGMSANGFNGMWMECFGKAVGEFEGEEKGNKGRGVGGMEVVQFKAEKGFWERRWGKRYGEFVGVDPRSSVRK